LRHLTLFLLAGPAMKSYMPEPFIVLRRDLFEMFGSPRLAQRIIHAGWIEIVRRGKPGRETLFDFHSAKGAYERLKRGEDPPLLPCERKRKL
jgi:hypothetical protein